MTNYMDTNFNNNIQYIHSHMEKPAVSSDFFIALDGEKNHSEKKRHELKHVCHQICHVELACTTVL